MSTESRRRSLETLRLMNAQQGQDGTKGRENASSRQSDPNLTPDDADTIKLVNQDSEFDAEDQA